MERSKGLVKKCNSFNMKMTYFNGMLNSEDKFTLAWYSDGGYFQKGCGTLMRRAKRVPALLTAVCMACLLAACRKDEPDSMELTPLPVTMVPKVTGNATPQVSNTLSQVERITYYTLSDDLKSEEVTAVLPEGTKMTIDSLVRYVAGTMEESNVTVGIDSVMSDKSTVIISFMRDSAPVCGVGADLEEEVLDAIAQSVLENFSDYTSIVYRVEGMAYQSENRSYDIDYVYLGN